LGDPYDFPIFNIADSAAVVGTICLAVVLVAMDVKSLAGRRKPGTDTAQPHDPYSGGLEVDNEALDELKQTAAEVRRGERFTPKSRTGWEGEFSGKGS